MPTEAAMKGSSQEINPVFTLSQFDEVYLPSVNRQTFEKIDSKTLYRSNLKDFLSKKQHLFVIIGMDSGLLANYVLDAELPTGNKYIFVELDAVLELLNVDIPSQLSHKVQVMSLKDFKERITTENNEIYIAKDEISIHKSFGAKFAYLQEYLLLSAEVEKIIQHEDFNQKVGFTQKLFFKRQFQNLAENLHPASLLRNQFVGQRCIVLGGGPSLDMHIDWVKAHQQDMVIFAVSRISKLLIEKGVRPHLVVSVDPQQLSMDVSKDLLRLTDKTVFINSYHVVPGLISQWRGKSAYLGTRYPWSNLEGKVDNIESIGPTVTNSAIQLAIEMGFSEILLSGVDFCYSSSGHTHTQGSIEAKIGPSLSKFGEWVETYAGNQAETPIQLIHAMHSLTEQAKNSTNGQIYNLSQDAAKVPGIAYRSHTSFDFESSNFDAFDRLHGLIPDYSSEESRRDLTICHRHIAATNKKLVAISKLAHEALACNRKLQAAHDSDQKSQGKMDKLKQRIDTIEQEINVNYSQLARFIKFFGCAEFAKFLNPASTDEWQQDQMLAMTDAYYHAFAANSDYLSKLMCECKARLLSRRAEMKIPAPLAELEKYWLENLEPGRVHVWKERHQKALNTLTTEDEQIIARLEQAFDQEMSRKSHEVTAAAKKASSLAGVQAKLILLFRHNKVEALAQTVKLLSPLIGKDKEAQRLFYLGENYLHQLENKPEAALDSLLKIPDDDRTEAEMREIIGLALTLQQLDLASEVLSKILSYSDEYAPKYAQVLKLQRQWQPALNVYLDYLDKFPGDVPVWLKLGQFMIEIGERDAAITAFSHALQAEPDNRIATHYLEQFKTLD